MESSLTKFVQQMADAPNPGPEAKGQGSSGSDQAVEQAEQPARRFVLPDNCVCTVVERGSTDFTWTYRTACPVGFREHPTYRDYLGVIKNLGQGFGGRPGMGSIIIDDGKVRSVTTCVVSLGSSRQLTVL